MASAEPNIVVALISGWVRMKDESVMVLQGEAYAADHPIVKKYPHFFGPHELRVAPAVEQATAAPGEKRGKK